VPQFCPPLTYTPRQACAITGKGTSNNCVFHIGFHKISTQYEHAICRKIRENISTDIEQGILSYHSKKIAPWPALSIDMNKAQNTVSFKVLNEIYDNPIIRSLKKDQKLLIFPCPNKRLFVTTDIWMKRNSSLNNS
jgi:hypothetical protein